MASGSAQLLQIPDIELIESAPFDKLLPLVKAVLNHRGIGTTAECLRAAKPFFVCPVLHTFGDLFWCRLVSKIGVAVSAQPLKFVFNK